MFLFEVLEETVHSFDTFVEPTDSQSLLLPTSTPPSGHLSAVTPTSNQEPPPAPPVVAPKNSAITLQLQVHVSSAVLQLHQHKKPLAEFSISNFAVAFEDGGKDGEEELTMRLGVSVDNILLIDKREGKASPHYPYIIAPKNRDITMLKFSFLEYP